MKQLKMKKRDILVVPPRRRRAYGRRRRNSWALGIKSPPSWYQCSISLRERGLRTLRAMIFVFAWYVVKIAN